MEWQPIETAPKDDSLLLLWASGHYGSAGSVKLGSFREDDMCGDLGAMWLENDYDDFSCTMASTPISATHWMPLPPAPKEQA